MSPLVVSQSFVKVCFVYAVYSSFEGNVKLHIPNREPLHLRAFTCIFIYAHIYMHFRV